MIDPTGHIRAYGLPLGLYNITCGTKKTRVRLQMQSYKKITVLDMNKEQNVDLEAKPYKADVFNVSKGHLITF